MHAKYFEQALDSSCVYVSNVRTLSQSAMLSILILASVVLFSMQILILAGEHAISHNAAHTPPLVRCSVPICFHCI